MGLLRKVCAGEPSVLDALDRVTARPNGTNQHTEGLYNVQTLAPPTGNTASAALRRLRKDRPDLHALVLAGDKTPHGAMIEAGFRPKTITVPVDVPKLARVLRERFTPDELRELITLLSEG